MAPRFVGIGCAFDHRGRRGGCPARIGPAHSCQTQNSALTAAVRTVRQAGDRRAIELEKRAHALKAEIDAHGKIVTGLSGLDVQALKAEIEHLAVSLKKQADLVRDVQNSMEAGAKSNRLLAEALDQKLGSFNRRARCSLPAVQPRSERRSKSRPSRTGRNRWGWSSTSRVWLSRPPRALPREPNEGPPCDQHRSDRTAQPRQFRSEADGISILEIGTLFGIGAAAVYEAASNECENVHLMVIDPLDGYYASGSRDILTGAQVSETTLRQNWSLAPIPEKDFTIIKHLSTNRAAIEAARKREYDVLIIDGDHSFDGVKFDFENYAPMVRPGGYILFDDYDVPEWPDIKRYVDSEIVGLPTLYRVGAAFRTAVFQVKRAIKTGARTSVRRKAN